LFVLGTTILVGIGGYIVALIGPEDGPARKLAEKYELLPGHAARVRALEEDLRSAHQAYERGDIFDLERAVAHLVRARKLDPSNAAIVGDQALALCAQADAVYRW